MNRLFVFAALLIPFASSFGQQAPPPPPPSEGSVRIDARREVVINWSLGDQVWLLSGNSSNSVRISAYSQSKLIDTNPFRWPV